MLAHWPDHSEVQHLCGQTPSCWGLKACARSSRNTGIKSCPDDPHFLFFMTSLLMFMSCSNRFASAGDTSHEGSVIRRPHIQYGWDGAGADGGATPRFAAYGASKRGLAQLGKSLQVQPGVLHSNSTDVKLPCRLLSQLSSQDIAVTSLSVCSKAPRQRAQRTLRIMLSCC